MITWRLPAALVLLFSWLPFVSGADDATANGPRRVAVGFHLASVPAIDEPTETFTAICLVHFRWHEPSLAGGEGGRKVLLDDAALEKANEIWRPDLDFVNETTAATPKHTVLTLLPDGTVEYDREFEVTLRTIFDLRSFPFDRQTLQIEIGSFAYSAKEVMLEPIPGMMKKSRLRLPQWESGELRWSTSLVDDELEREKYHRLNISVPLTRKPGYYVWQVFVPLFILIMVASTVFFLPAEDLSDRIGVITTSLLTVVALSYTVRQDLPRISYLTTVDHLFLSAYLFLCAKLIGMLLVRRFAEHNAPLARKIDRMGRWAYPSAFLAANAATILLSITRA